MASESLSVNVVARVVDNYGATLQVSVWDAAAEAEDRSAKRGLAAEDIWPDRDFR